MAIVSFNKIKEIANKNNETHIVDLGKIDKKLEGVSIPIKVKSFEDTIKLKNDFKIKREKLTIEYKPFTRLPKSLKEIIMQDGTYRRGMTENTYYQVIKLSEDNDKIERMKFRERLFNVLIHIDMGYVNEDGKTMWQDAEIPANDYNKLVDLFSEIIQHEIHVELLEVIIDSIRNGETKDEEIDNAIRLYTLRKHLGELSEEERKEFFTNLNKTQEMINNISKNVEEQNKAKDNNKEEK